MIVDFLVKKGLLSIVPIEKTFFVTVDFISSAKLSYESILFNYQNLSPFKDSALSYIQKDEKLMLWFYEKSYQKVFTVPEGFLYYHYFLNSDNTLIMIENKTSFVIQDGILKYQTSCVEPLCTDKELLLKKFNIQKVIEKSSSWHSKHHKKIINRPLYILLKYFIDRKLLMKTIKKYSIASLIPLSVLLGVMVVSHVVAGQYLQEELDKVNEKRASVKKDVADIFQKITQNRQSIAQLNSYFKKYPSFDTSVLKSLASVLKEEKAQVFYYVHNSHMITMHLLCHNIENFLDKLSKIKQIDSYNLTRQTKTNSGLYNITLEITLKRGNINEQ